MMVVMSLMKAGIPWTSSKSGCSAWAFAGVRRAIFRCDLFGERWLIWHAAPSRGRRRGEPWLPRRRHAFGVLGLPCFDRQSSVPGLFGQGQPGRFFLPGQSGFEGLLRVPGLFGVFQRFPGVEGRQGLLGFLRRQGLFGCSGPGLLGLAGFQRLPGRLRCFRLFGVLGCLRCLRLLSQLGFSSLPGCLRCLCLLGLLGFSGLLGRLRCLRLLSQLRFRGLSGFLGSLGVGDLAVGGFGVGCLLAPRR